MIEMVQANPALMQIAGDLMVKNMDWPGAEELSERLKLTLPPEIQKAEAAKKQQTMPPEMQQAMQQFEASMQQIQQQLDQTMQVAEELKMENTKLKNDNSYKEKETVIKAVLAEVSAYDSETKRLQVMQQAMTPEQIQKIVMQTLTDLMTPNTIQLPQEEMMGEMPAVPQEMANMPPQGMETMEQPINGTGI